jgi:hypothetical protein
MPKGRYSLKAVLGGLARFSAVLFLLGCAQSLYAQTYFDFSCGGCGGASASGILTTSLVSGDTYLVTALSGTQGGNAMTLLPPGGYAGNDNDVFSVTPFLDTQGLSFSILLGSVDYNIYYDPGLSQYLECNSVDNPVCETGQGIDVTFALTPAPSPESGTLILFGSGFLALAGILRRKLFA